MLLSLLISGPQQLGNDIDVYLTPLIEDLELLWEVGIEAFDAYQQQFFILKVVLLWTINDFPAYGNLSSCIVKGYFACPNAVKKHIHIDESMGKKTHSLGIDDFFHTTICMGNKKRLSMVSKTFAPLHNH